MSKAEIIKAICKKPDYRFTHEEMMRMSKKELLEYYPMYSEAEPSEDLEKAAMEYEITNRIGVLGSVDVVDAFIAGAEWQKEQMMDEWLKDRDGCFWDGVEEGKKAMKEQMLKDAVDGDYDCQYMTPAVFLDKYLDGVMDGDKVKIIIVEED